jgi:hypothetical protein
MKNKAKKSSAFQCLVKGCGLTPYKRGLCSKHSVAARRAVNAGITDWEELVELGLALPIENPRGKLGDFLLALIDAKVAAKSSRRK